MKLMAPTMLSAVIKNAVQSSTCDSFVSLRHGLLVFDEIRGTAMNFVFLSNTLSHWSAALVLSASD